MIPRSPDGLLLVDKPAGPTSHDIVAFVRRRTGRRRSGHAGTLDPAATGLLVVMLGRATRLARYLPMEPKAYTGTLRLGIRTATDDLEGDVIETRNATHVSREAVAVACRALTGDIEQVPPAVSAKKIAGRRAYAIARAGGIPEIRPARVRVSRFEVLPTEDPTLWRFSATVSTGTYIRSLARDLGEALGTGGALASLRRTSAGAFSIDDAVVLPGDRRSRDEVDLGPGFVPFDRVPLGVERVVVLDPEAIRRFTSGAEIPHPDGRPSPTVKDVEVAVSDAAGRLLGVGVSTETALRPRVVLAVPGEPNDHLARGTTL